MAVQGDVTAGAKPSGGEARPRRATLSPELVAILAVGVALAGVMLTMTMVLTDVFSLKLGAIREDVREIRGGQVEIRDRLGRVEAGQGVLLDRLGRVESGQAALRSGQADLRDRMARVESGQAALRTGQAELRDRLGRVESGQADLRDRMARVEAGQVDLRDRMVRVEAKVDVLVGDEPPDRSAGTVE